MPFSKEEAKIKIRELVQNYINNKDKLSKDSETDTRVKFIDRMFESLGWDVFGTTISDEVSREVGIQEKEGRKKKADYTFKVNGISRFVVEAKSMGESVFEPAFIVQTVNYAYNKACSWAVLTNFNKLAIYYVDRNSNTPFYKIDLGDIATFEQNFEILWYLSKESAINNLLEKEAKQRGLKSDKVPIDQQLLNDLKIWRELLSNDIRKRYKDYESHVIDEIVQRITDRLIFIRKTEDGKLEEPKLDQIIRRHNDNAYSDIKKLFAEYREKYDSKLFEEDRKTLHESDKIDISNEVIESVVRGMYRAKSIDIEYDFSAIDSDILGNIYEQYLAYVLSQTEKKVKLKGGISHRKEQGIYYTPTYIVDYIVRNTLGEMLKKTKLKDANKLKILDPACGSGSFLIKAFDVLNDYYVRNDDSYQQMKLDLTGGTTFSKKVEIITNNIFGVDLDPKAVEIAQLNLLLKIAERGHRLPVLQKNIKCGNSLIDDESLAGDRAFKWSIEFLDITKNGGFDVIIGNPPYGAELNENERNFIDKKYKWSSDNKNTALIFIEKSLELLKPNGIFGMIVPKSLAFSQMWKPARQMIKTNLVKIVDVSKAFQDVLLEQVIIILSKNIKSKTYLIEDLNSSRAEVEKSYIDSTDSIILHPLSQDLQIFKKMNQSGVKMSHISKTSRGLPFQKYLTGKKTPYSVIKGKNIARYRLSSSNEYLPKSLIENNKKAKQLKQPKIVSQRIVAHVTKPTNHIIIMSSLDTNGLITVDTVENTIITDKNYSLELLLSLLNSKLISWYAYRYIFSKAIRTMDFDDYYIGKIPLPTFNKNKQDDITELTKKIITLHKNLSNLGNKNTNETQKIQQNIDRIQAEVDNKIYKLYGLTEKEIKTVESS